jgi:hypothetical protein
MPTFKQAFGRRWKRQISVEFEGKKSLELVKPTDDLVSPSF